MDNIQHIIIDHTLKRIGDAAFADYLCHAYCYEGCCTFERNGQAFRFEAGDCLIIARRGDLVKNLQESDDFKVDVIYVTQKFIELSTPQSNYGMRGQLFLFQNPIMKLKPEQQEICRLNFLHGCSIELCEGFLDIGSCRLLYLSLNLETLCYWGTIALS